jgi:hypothetical protein
MTMSAIPPDAAAGSSPTAQKKLFLVCYDYGMGGLWGAMMAPSEQEIVAAYPELAVVHERPRWMSDAVYEQICREQRHDVDGAPWGILDVVLADRAQD